MKQPNVTERTASANEDQAQALTQLADVAQEMLRDRGAERLQSERDRAADGPPAPRDPLARYDAFGRKEPVRGIPGHWIFRAVPGLIEYFDRQVPDSFVTPLSGREDEPDDVEVRCPCGERPQARVNAIAACPCDRFFYNAGAGRVLVAGPDAPAHLRDVA